MNIKELAKKYDLNKDDFWEHKQSKSWILTHDACTKIGNQEGIHLLDINVINSEPDLVRVLVTMKKGSVTITTFGEADRKNCFNPYLAMMSEKRGIDRCILKLINAYEYGVYSEVEADSFKKEETLVRKITDDQKSKIITLISDKSDDIKKKTNNWLEDDRTYEQAEKMIERLKSMDYDKSVRDSLLETAMDKLDLSKTDAVLKLNELSSDNFEIETFDKLPLDSAIQLKDEIVLGGHG